MARYAIDMDKLHAVPTDAEGWFSMSDIENVYPGVPQRTIRDALVRLSDQIETTGAKRGKNTGCEINISKLVLLNHALHRHGITYNSADRHCAH
ncbi:hypothetical protein [Pseudohongiella spirulinae]|uniref:Uncharacterized protein n=1 Tax=Pseudohongiella spirulinae TaxID=1249552 RepID=A0A0S2KGC4_9GAMM|nr:hypothetical protein [Pseudohongiella spirulinae]ALO47388.1 hypothetical protein PS2015_2756 [Pseudohongiella spirulinae]